MLRIKKYGNWLLEAKDPEKYADIIEEVKRMFQETVDESGGELQTMIKAYSQNPKDIKVREFINDSDIYDFYLKFRNDIDQILNDINYFDSTAQEKNAFGLYEYTVKGTETAFLEVVKMIS